MNSASFSRRLISRLLLNIALVVPHLQQVTEARKREIAVGEMYSDEPCGDKVDEVVQEVGICDAVDGGVEGEEEE